MKVRILSMYSNAILARFIDQSLYHDRKCLDHTSRYEGYILSSSGDVKQILTVHYL